MNISNLYKPQTLPAGSNIDPNYWTDNGDGTYTATPLLIYNIARDAVEYFKNQIVRMDKEEVAVTQYGNRTIKLGDYHFRDTNVTITDTYENDMLSREYELKYADQIKEVNRRWKEYQKSHPEEFNITYGVKSPALGGHDEASYINGFKFEDLNLSLQDAVAACSAAMSLLAKYKSGGAEYDTLPMYEMDKYLSKKEFAEAHKAYRQSLYDELGVPAKVEIPKDQLPKTTGDSAPKFSSKNYEKGTKNPAPNTITIVNFDEKIMNTTPNEEAFGKFADGFVSYITTTTKEQWINALADKIRTIGEEFTDKFNETSKTFYAVPYGPDGLYIYKRTPEGEEDDRYITLFNKTDHWDCDLNALIDGLVIQFKGVVNTYGDFKKILKIFARCLETAGETDSSNDLAEVADSL